MTNLIPIWKDPSHPPSPDCHRSWPINIAAVTQTRPAREGHAIVPLTCSFCGPILDWRGRRIPLCILSHSAAVGTGPNPHYHHHHPLSPVMSDHLLKGIYSCKITLSFYHSKNRLWSLKKEIWVRGERWGESRGWWVGERGEKGVGTLC